MELLDQAAILARENYLAASTVIAGGVLETHLRQLADRYGLIVTGAGSISAYNAEIAKARRLGTITNITAADVSQITAWRQDRNNAAHAPGSFKRNEDHVDLMIQDIRGFTSRTT